MVSAIGPASFAGTNGGGSPTAGIEAQINRYKKELSGCVNCSTANTREGRENIQAISNKISASQARLDEITAAKSSTRPATASSITSPDITASKNAPAPVSGLANTNASGRLDVFV